jgi:hypothetical protein
MKKLMTIMTACFVAGLACADGSTVTSANIVGYKQITLQPGFNMIALNWQQVGYTGGVEQVAINSLFDPTEQTANLTAGATLGTADRILTWDPIAHGYATYFFKNNAVITNQWVKSTANNVATLDTIPNGTGMWLFKQGASSVTVTLSGQVKFLGVAHQHVIEPGFNMIGSGFASDAPLNDARWNWISDGVISGATLGTADRILNWDPIAHGYTTYFFKNNAVITNQWVKSTANNVATTDSVPLGSGAWYFRQGASATVLNEAQPY